MKTAPASGAPVGSVFLILIEYSYPLASPEPDCHVVFAISSMPILLPSAVPLALFVNISPVTGLKLSLTVYVIIAPTPSRSPIAALNDLPSGATVIVELDVISVIGALDSQLC